MIDAKTGEFMGKVGASISQAQAPIDSRENFAKRRNALAIYIKPIEGNSILLGHRGKWQDKSKKCDIATDYSQRNQVNFKNTIKAAWNANNRPETGFLTN